jgi:hypothetical protein
LLGVARKRGLETTTRALAAVAALLDLRRSIPLIKAREPVDAGLLCDLAVDLRKLTGGAVAAR